MSSVSVEQPIGPECRVNSRLSTCMACGSRMAPCLALAGSPRCHDCRDVNAPLRADLVEGTAGELRLVMPEPAYRLREAA
jgi:hypothetical protein